VILVTHQLQYLEQADLIVVLKNGEIQVKGLKETFSRDKNGNTVLHFYPVHPHR
jgi:ABC-type transport system involved in cytochrome bd biosynthesis fused ATPase/permease subunit